jgi:hypothetical protein
LQKLDIEKKKEALEKLNKIKDDISKGVGVEYKGIGYIDGTTNNLKNADKEKKTCFLAVKIDAIANFRKEMGFDREKEKNLHITLGLKNGNDIHFEKTGEITDAKGKVKEETKPISKEANLKYADLFTDDFKEKIILTDINGQPKLKSEKK